MNASNAKEYLPLVAALAEGKTIQQYSLNQQSIEMAWNDDLSPTWVSEPRFYRVKPEKPKPRKWWILFNNEKALVYTDEDSAYRANSVWTDGELVPVAEVMK